MMSTPKTVAYLVTGGKVFVDSAHTNLPHAVRQQANNPGARIEELVLKSEVDATLREALAAVPEGSPQAQEVAASDARDAGRWRTCEKAGLFPEFCSHLPVGNGWYMPTYPARQPPIFQTAGEAADELFNAALASQAGKQSSK